MVSRLKTIRRIVEQTLTELPSEIRAALDESGARIVLLDAPPPDVDPDVFGTCSGATAYESGSPFLAVTESPQIELYLSSFADLADDPEGLAEEVRLTVIHEVGHFLGFEEDELEDI